MSKVKNWFERTLVSIRFVALLAVIASLIGCLGVFYISTIDLWKLFAQLAGYTDAIAVEGQHRSTRTTTISYVIELVDGYLLALMMLIFAIGTYQIFVSQIDRTHIADESGAVWVVNSLDDLKARLGKVVIIILIVEFFEQTIGMGVTTSLDALYTAGAIALIGLALYLSHAR